MEKIFCADVGRDILPEQCYKAKSSPTCQKCLQYQKVLLNHDSKPPTKIELGTPTPRVKLPIKSTWSIRKAPKRLRKYHPPKRIKSHLLPMEILREHPELAQEIRDVPFLLKLDESFWRNPKFLRWQLMRLNDEYRADLDDVLSVHEAYLEARGKFDEAKSLFFRLRDDRPPDPKESFEKWQMRMEAECHSLEYDFMYLIFFADLSEKRRHLSLNRPDNHLGRGDSGHKFVFGPLAVESMMSPPPIDYRVRFPLPYLLNKLSPWPEKKTGRGRPLTWARNLLAYELSHYYGVDEKTITSLLFRIRKSAKYSELHPKIQTTKRIIKGIEKTIKKSYPARQPKIVKP